MSISCPLAQDDHTHTSFDYRLDDTRVVCNPRGYVSRRTGEPENKEFDWCRVVEI